MIRSGSKKYPYLFKSVCTANNRMFKNNSRTVFGLRSHTLLYYMAQWCNKNECMYRIKLLLLTVLIKNHMAVALSAGCTKHRLPADVLAANSQSVFVGD